MYFLLKMRIFHCHVSLPEGMVFLEVCSESHWANLLDDFAKPDIKSYFFWGGGFRYNHHPTFWGDHHNRRCSKAQFLGSTWFHDSLTVEKSKNPDFSNRELRELKLETFMDFIWIWHPPCNSGKWRLIGIPESTTKHVIILVITATGRGPYQRFHAMWDRITLETVRYPFPSQHFLSQWFSSNGVIWYGSL